MINLVGNAIKFTDDGSIIVKVEFLQKNDKYNVDISVIDTGIGIAKDQQKFIFKEFEQADESHEKIGTGLGLTISNKFAEIVNGRITLESQLNRGSTFTFHLSDIEKSDIAIDSIYNKNEHIDFEFKLQKVMIVDDIRNNRDVLKAHCINLNLTPKTYYSPKDALKNMDTFTPDIVITDLRMPQMNGEEFAKKVKSINPNIPIICITASINPDERYELQYFDDLLNKPIASSKLAKSMAKYMETQVLEDTVSEFDADTLFATIELTDNEKEKLKNDYIEKIRTLKVGINPKKTKEVGESLKEHSNKELREFGENLLQCSKTLDVEKMVNNINSILKYLENL